MTVRAWLVGLATGALALSAAARAVESPQAYWDHVQAAVRQGAYQDALQSLDALLKLTPDDPRVALYQDLCRKRLRGTSTFSAITPTQLQTLQDRLEEESRRRRRLAKEQQTIERRMKREQARWAQQLKQMEREAIAARKQARAKAQAQAVAAAQAQTEATRPAQLAEAPAPAAAPAPPSPPAEPVARRLPDRSVELAPVQVPTVQEPTVPLPAAPVTPSLVGRAPPPPGAVEIHAQQMRVVNERNLAIAEGSVEVVYGNAILTADRMTLFTDTHDVYAEGHVRLERGDEVFRGEMVHFNFDSGLGRFLQGTVYAEPWYEYGRSVEHIAQGVYQVTPGYITSCDHQPPHFKFYGRRATVFSDDRLARAQNVALFVERLPFLYLPWLSVADRHSPFFVTPGERNPWGAYVLTGYQYELASPLGQHKGTYRVDYRENFGWGFGSDHQLESERFGKALLKLYYNDQRDKTRPLGDLPKGAEGERYRVLVRHVWRPLPHTNMVTDIQEYSDREFRKDFVYREEFEEDDVTESFISTVTSTDAYTLSTLLKKRMNRYDAVTEVLPQVTLDVPERPIGASRLFSRTVLDVAHLQSAEVRSDPDVRAARVDWFEELKYALGLFRPVEVTPRGSIRQTYYSKGAESVERIRRNFLVGQMAGGVDTSLKLFRIFPVVTDALNLDINQLRHVVTPTAGYSYVHEPTVPNSLVSFAKADSPSNAVTYGLENKLQTRRANEDGSLSSVDLARVLVSLPYTFKGSGNKQGGRWGDWSFDVETSPWPWMRLESDWVIPSHFDRRVRDSRIPHWNVDLVIVGGQDRPDARAAPGEVGLSRRALTVGPRRAIHFMPMRQWYLGMGHRYSQNDKTETVVEYDWRLSEKWQVNTFHRVTWKQVVGGAKRFYYLREYQYSLQRDLHDWVAEFVYRVDQDLGNEVFFVLTLKAYPELPFELDTSYNEPKAEAYETNPFLAATR